jgi:uncharacterized repeat protein (TIGR03803 family)
VHPCAASGAGYEVLHAFERPGTQPMAKLVRHSDGNFYGTTVAGGAHGFGTVFRATPGGAVETLVSFSGPDGASPGLAPLGGLAMGPGGDLFGATSGGGSGGYGLVFKVSVAGAYSVVTEFTGISGAVKGSVPGTLVPHPDGYFYGTTQAGGGAGFGTVFRLSPLGSLTTLAEFTGTAGAFPGEQPVGALAVKGSLLYGVTRGGGASGEGTLFRVDTSGAFASLHAFDGEAGSRPAGGLLLHTDELLYGTTEFGGGSGFGVAFKATVAAPSTFTVLHEFADPTGSQPVGELLAGSDGALYGAAAAGGMIGWGALYRMTTAGVYSVLEDLTGEDGVAAGSVPRAGFALGADGAFYGTASAGGAANLGVLFKVTQAGSFSGLANFSRSDGWFPSGAPVPDGAGGFLFPVAEGGDGGGGVILRIDSATGVAPAAALGGIFGDAPDGRLFASGGFFHGVTGTGGASGRGAAFRYASSTGVEFVTTATTSTGSVSEGPLIRGNDGALYGTSREGGTFGRGAVYKINAAGTRTRVVALTGTAGTAPGQTARGSLVLAPNGSFYGVAERGGSADRGVLFRILPSGTYIAVVEFAALGPRSPRGGLVMGGDGMIYGTTAEGGAADAGTLGRLDPSSDSWSIVAEFTGSGGVAPGSGPEGDLVPGIDGKLYGTCVAGGEAGFGCVFSWSATSGLETLVSYTGEGGAAPGIGGVGDGLGLVHTGGVLPAADGTLYGVAPGGGPKGGGVAFRIAPETPLETWKRVEVGDRNASDLADSDGDGTVLLVEYALGLSPLVFDGDSLPGAELTVYPEGTRLAMCLRRDPLRHDVRIVVEASESLSADWTMLATSNGGPFAGPGYVSGETGGTEVRMVKVRDIANAGSFLHRYFRVRVERL